MPRTLYATWEEEYEEHLKNCFILTGKPQDKDEFMRERANMQAFVDNLNEDATLTALRTASAMHEASP